MDFYSRKKLNLKEQLSCTSTQKAIWKHGILIILCMVPIINDLLLYLRCSVKTEGQDVQKHHQKIDLKKEVIESSDHNNPTEVHPRVLYSRIIGGKLFEIHQLLPYSQKININEAGLDLLKTLPGIGETRAAGIIKYRSEHGFFACIKDLEKIRGFNYSIISRIKPYVRFGIK